MVVKSPKLMILAIILIVLLLIDQLLRTRNAQLLGEIIVIISIPIIIFCLLMAIGRDEE